MGAPNTNASALPKWADGHPFWPQEKKNCFAAGQNLGLQKRPPKTDPKRKNCFVSSAQYQCFGAPKMGRWAPFLASEKKKTVSQQAKILAFKKGPQERTRKGPMGPLFGLRKKKKLFRSRPK